MDVHKTVLTLMVVTTALVILGILWHLMNMDVMVSELQIKVASILMYAKFMNADVDECARNIHNCEHTCENTIGSFLCGCNAGYELTSDGRTCQGTNKTMHTATHKNTSHACS